MKLLIDSSTNYLYLALKKGDEIISFHRSGKNDHSETLVDYIEKFLKANNLTTKDILEVYIGRGPGSYTGLRIAGTVGKVFAYANNIKLYSFSSLDLILSKVIETDGLYISRIDAKKNHSYYKIIKVCNKEIKIVKEEEFGDNSIFEEYKNYLLLEMNDDFFNDDKMCFLNILKYHLYQEEDKFDYTPNYIRSGI